MPAHVPPVETKRKLPHLPELDGLRGLAALGVLFHHFMQPLGDDAAVHHSAVSGAIIAASGYGAMGVDVFFVLSGFLISSLLLVDREKTSYFHNFYWKRVLRIVPVYLVHLSLVAVLAPGSLGYILLSSVFLVNFASVFHMNGGGPTWTLSIEEQFYVLWPQAVRRLRLEFVYWLAFALIASSNLARILVPLWHGGINVQYTFYRCDGLALGAVLACQWFSPWRGSGFIRWTLDALNGKATLLAAAVGAVALLTESVAPILPWSSAPMFKMLAEGLRLSVMNFLIYRLLRFLLGYRERHGRTLPLLASAPMVYLGAISYAMYMYQLTVLHLLDQRYGSIAADHTAGIVGRALLALSVLLAACTVSRYGMELPVQRLRRYIVRPSQAVRNPETGS